MITFYSEDHHRRDSKTELSGGLLVPPFECPRRVDIILERIRAVGLGDVLTATDHGLDLVQRVHGAEYLEFLSTAWERWIADGYEGEAIATSWPARRMQNRCPRDIDGQLGYYALAAETSISEGTWEAALSSVNVALSAQRVVAEGTRSAFALCRPPGHHAAFDLYGGYCFLNNAAIAAEAFRDAGASRVAVLDVDFHHGNGTQDIFYDRSDVYFASLHGAPEDAFPHFLGYADETGEGAGEGANLNLPMRAGTPWAEWRDALDTACDAALNYGVDAVVISFGADTFEHDPISFFKLTSEDFIRMGSRLAALSKPTLFVMEGGYAVEQLGTNTVNLLTGFECG